MLYAHVTNGTVDQVGIPPATAYAEGRWWDLRTLAPAALTATGWLEVTETARPADTATQTSDMTWTLTGGKAVQTWTVRAKTQAEKDADTRTTNQGTLTAQAVAAITANETWIDNIAPQVQTAVDAMQARTYPAKPAAPTTVAQVAAILDAQYTSILTPLVLDLKQLSQAVETLNVELVATKRQLNATMRLVAGALDSTSGT